MSPQELLAKLKHKATAKKSKTLDAVFAVCQDQVDRGSRDFSYSTISRIGRAQGVPKAQSIRNKSGEDYKALINFFEGQQKGTYKSIKRRNSGEWIDDIADPKIRFLVSKQQAELMEAKRLVREIVPPGTTIIVDDRKGGIAPHRLSDVERRALEFLASEEFLKEWGYVAGDRGEVMDSEGNRLFKPATLDALKKVLQYL